MSIPYTDRRTYVALLAGLLIVAPAIPALAGAIGAKKPSQVVNSAALPASTVACAAPSAEMSVPAIPAGQVLVVTAYSWSAIVAMPGPLHLIMDLATTDGVTTTNRFESTASVSSGSGVSFDNVSLPTGVVVKATEHICLVPVNTPNVGFIGGSVSGYLTKDK